MGPRDIEPESRLVDDLDLDSLALAELGAAMMVDAELQEDFDALLLAAWNGLTVGQFYAKCRTRS